MITIDDHIPIPTGPTMGRHRKYPFDDLKVGQSFLARDKTKNVLRACIKLAVARTGFTFVIRDSPEGCRIWRET